MPEYIEREALLEEIHTARNQLVLGKTAATKLEKMVRAAPAADAAPVVHGRWIKHQDEYENWCECSMCGKSPDSPLDETPFCPNCGAKMDLEEDHE